MLWICLLNRKCPIGLHSALLMLLLKDYLKSVCFQTQELSQQELSGSWFWEAACEIGASSLMVWSLWGPKMQLSKLNLSLTQLWADHLVRKTFLKPDFKKSKLGLEQVLKFFKPDLKRSDKIGLEKKAMGTCYIANTAQSLKKNAYCILRLHNMIDLDLPHCLVDFQTKNCLCV